jgi:hypothetical protein
MATRRFCDICDAQLKAEDAMPLVRAYEYRPPGRQIVNDETVSAPLLAVAYVEITNANNIPLTDICMGCKLLIVTNGKPTSKPSPAPIATLQPEVPVDRPVPLKPFRAGEPPSSLLPEAPPKAGPVVFEPSLPGDRPNPRMG